LEYYNELLFFLFIENLLNIDIIMVAGNAENFSGGKETGFFRAGMEGRKRMRRGERIHAFYA
jgi:hypothetical protein